MKRTSVDMSLLISLSVRAVTVLRGANLRGNCAARSGWYRESARNIDKPRRYAPVRLHPPGVGMCRP